MKIVSMRTRNYRTLEDISIDFPATYTAICGANDSGKTNVIRAMRAFVREEWQLRVLGFDDLSDLDLKDDYPKWKLQDSDAPSEEMFLSLELELHRELDAGLYQVVTKQLAVDSVKPHLRLKVSVTYDRTSTDARTVSVEFAGQTFDGLAAQEVLSKLQSSTAILFHNSTEVQPGRLLRGPGVTGYLREISGQHAKLIGDTKKRVNAALAKVSKSQQSEFESLLGRLQTKYRVSLSHRAFDFGHLPFSITLGDKRVEVPLDDWGSGTRNRTLILLTLFRARQISQSEASATKITPVIVIEEPESFLHPSAQAEFGRVLCDLAEEFGVQVIVTTHSPYLLNTRQPASNVLLRRRTVQKQLRDTERVSVTTGNWMEPFATALGLSSSEFAPWKALLQSASDAILLVEGETDKAYLEMLRDEAHGASRLKFDGEIVPYEGTGSLQNTVLLRFVRNRYRKLLVTFDLDALGQLEKTLHALQMEKLKHYLPIGVNAPGKKNIEGLLPDVITRAVYANNASLVQAACAGTKAEQDSAKSQLKKLLLDEFKRVAQPGPEHYSAFYACAKAINKAFA